MGLDMYLSAHRYIGAWEHQKGTKREPLQADVLKALGFEGYHCEESPSLTVNFTIAYWRKSNAIHKWFVDTCAEGEDECQEIGVTREQLMALHDLCKEALASKNAELLPPQAGFLFGSTEIDDGYWNDIEDTIRMLSAILNDSRFDDWTFIYQASW
jgi:hypothetical protein